jgi:F-type H+-transporting ATPase subunit alpha
METLREALEQWLPSARRQLQEHRPEPSLEHIGRVVAIGDGVATIAGLPWTRLGELLHFEDGALGLAFRIEEDTAGCVLLSGGDEIAAGSAVHGTGEVFRVPVGEGLLGRVIDPTGAPIDDGPAITAEEFRSVDRPAPAIVDRDLVTTPLQTGLIAIDALIPLGRGQRELIIGDRKTGKTAIAVDTIINQRDTEVVCVYAAVGQKSSTVNQVISSVREHGAFERCIFVISPSEAPSGAQWMTPLAACTMAEYFRDRGQDALLIIDDLTKHAIIYRQLSLLLRRPPGREAYPGDIFYLHARLLERAAKLSENAGGGSLTVLPIAETQAGNLTAYIPTNLISITDGQIYLEPKLFYEGQRPAVNVGLSVSRVGGQTQAPVMKRLVETLRLDYAQFLELEVFARFGAMVDERTKSTLRHGERIRAILRQSQFEPLSLSEQVALLLALNDGKLDEQSPDFAATLKAHLAENLSERCSRLADRIDESGELSEEELQELSGHLDSILAELAAPPEEED